MEFTLSTFCPRFPVGVADVNRLFNKFLSEDAACNTWLNVRDRITYLDTLYRVKNAVGYHPWLQRKIRSARITRASDRMDRKIQYQEHTARQLVWFNGGREVHYLNKWGRFGGPHNFLLNGIEEVTGMDTYGVENWDESIRPKWADVPALNKVWRCSCCGSKSAECAEGFCPSLLEAVESPQFIAPIRTRSIMLLTKLRAYICVLRLSTLAEYNSAAAMHYEKTLWQRVKPQMMEAEHSDANASVMAGNVILNETNPSEQAQASGTNSDMIWNKLSSNEIDTNYSYLTDRFNLMGSFEWKTTDARSASVFNFQLPKDFISDNAERGILPTIQPFNIFQYCRTDIEVKIHLNSNKFHVGQLQASWQYMEQYTQPCDTDNVYHCSQLPHCIVSAGSSNEVTLYIPYKYVNAYMSTKSTSKTALEELDMGTLRCLVLSPLKTSTSGPTSCFGSVFIRFPKCSFTGMRDGSTKYVQPQMMEAAVAMTAMKAIDRVVGDRNCDNPTLSSVPSYLIPTGSHSWSLGTGLVEPLHNLRLDNKCPGVGRVGIDNSETNIGIPCRTFGLLKAIDWSSLDKSKNSQGYCLFDCDAHPQLDKKHFKKNTKPSMMDTYNVPPVTVISSLYQQWRGTLEFRFDFVCSMFHTGRVLVAYIPGLHGDSCTITLNQARSSPHMVFSLQDSNTFTFKVPYISDKPWWYRKYCSSQRRKEENAPSKLVMFVLNPLVVMESVSPAIEILVYVRAGDDFEVSVPVQPSVGLGYNRINAVDVKNKARALEGHYPYWCTNWNGFGESKKYIVYYGTDAFGSASMFYEPESVIKSLKENQAVYWAADNPELTGTFVRNKKLVNIHFIVLLPVPEQWVLAVPFGPDDEAEAKVLATAYFTNRRTPWSSLAVFALNYESDDGDKSSGNPFFSPKVYDFKTDSPTFEIVERNSEDKYDSGTIVNPVGSLPSTSCGQFNFNENFSDLKDIMRRYQLYLHKSVVVPAKTKVEGEALIQFPALPIGLEPIVAGEQGKLWNNIREGIIPLICSGYVFFRGSLRYRLIFTSNNGNLQGCKVWIQHHPDQIPTYGRRYNMGDRILPQDLYKNHNYGFYLQNMDVNSIIEVEVPFYQQGMYGLSQILYTYYEYGHEDDILDYIGLGDLVVGAQFGTIINSMDCNIEVYYSVGDDFSLSCFKGFPSVIFCDEIYPATKVSSRKGQVRKRVKPQMFSNLISSIVGGTVGALTTTHAGQPIINGLVKEVASTVSDSLGPKIDVISNEVVQQLGEIKLEMGGVIETTVISNAIGNLLHVLANPTPMTIAISICNILGTVLASSVHLIFQMKEALFRFFTRFWNVFQGVFFDGNRNVHHVQPESPGDEWYDSEDLKAIIGLIVVAIAGLFGYVGKMPNSYFNTMRNVAITTSLAINVINFLKALNEVIGKCFRFVIGVLNPQARLEMLLDADSVPHVLKWFEEVEYLMDARNKARMTYDKQLMDRVFDAAVFGSLLVSNNLDKQCPAGKIIFDMYTKICGLRNDLIERGAHPDVRFECFPLFITGEAGIGKSYLATSFSMDLLEAVNYQCSSSPIYYITPGLKHWSGCVNPAVLVSDDMFQVKGTNQEEELANLFKICSSSVLNPPMAAVADKERRLNPYIYLMFCNHAFPDLGNVMTCADAVYRRRKYLIHAEFTPEIRAKYGNILDASLIAREDMVNFAHLQFRFALNPKDPQTEYGPNMTYPRMMDIVRNSFVNHYRNERDNFTNRMRNMYRLDPNFRTLDLFTEMPELREQISLVEQRNLFRQTINEEILDLQDPLRDEEPYVTQFLARIKTAFKYQSDEWPDRVPLKDLLAGDDKALVHNVFQYHRYEDDPPDDYSFLEQSLYDNQNSTLFLGVLEASWAKVSAGGDMSFWQEIEPGQCLERMGLLLHFSKTLFGNIFGGIDIQLIRTSQTIAFCYFSGNSALSVIQHEGIKIKTHTLNGSITIRDFMGERVELGSMFDEPSENPKNEDMKNMRRSCIGVDTLNDLQGLLLRCLHNFYQFRKLQVVIGSMTSVEELQNLFKKAVDDQAFGAMLRAFLGAYKHSDSIGKLQMLLERMGNTTGEAINGDDLKEMQRLWREYARFIELLGINSIVCPCVRVYVRMIKDIKNVKFYSDRGAKGVYTYKNYMGLTETLQPCQCEGSICSNQMFCILFGQYYNLNNQDTLRQGMADAYNIRLLKFQPVEYEEAQDWFKKFMHKGAIVWHKYVKPTIGNILTFILEILPSILIVIGYLLAISGAIYCARKAKDVVSHMFSGGTPETFTTTETPEFKPEGHNYFKFDTNKPANKPKVFVAKRTFDTQSYGTKNQALHRHVINNTVILHVTYVEGDKRMVRSGRCLMLSGRKMLVLRHYMEEFSDVYKRFPDITFTLYFNVGGRSSNAIVYPVDLFKSILWAQVKGNYMKSNYGIVELPKYIPMFKNILPKIATKSMHESVTRECDFLSVGGTNVFDLIVTKGKSYAVDSSDITSEVMMDTVYTYRNQGRGLCGSVLICNTMCGGNGGIFAMHVAGSENTGEGVSEPLYREFLEEAVGLGSVTYAPVDMPLEPIEKEKVVLDSNLMLYGCVNEKFAHRESGKTKILPSLIAGVYPITSEPSPLKPNDPRQPEGSHPMRDGCQKHGSGVVKPFLPQNVERVVDHLTNRLNQVIEPIRMEIKPLSLQQATCGDIDIPYFEALNWKTSEGFPLKAMRPSSAHDKRWLFDLDEQENGYQLQSLHPLLQNQLAIRDKCFADKIKPTTIYEDCLKDARLPIEKCKVQGKTRIFSIAPIACTIDIKQNLGDYCASFKNSRIVNSCGIGINPDSMEWSKLVNYLFEVGNKIITIDYSNFGPCLMSQCVAAYCETIVKWHKFHGAGAEHVDRVSWLLECDILNPMHLCENVVYQTINGIASGSPLTGEINSGTNMIYLYNIWMEIMGEVCPEWKDPYYFDMFVRFVVYGDDLIMCVSDEVIGYFNALSMKEYFARHGLTVTSAQKDAKMVPYDLIINSTFLKRGFYPHPSRYGAWLAPVDVHSVKETLNWIKQSSDDADATLQNCIASLDLAYGHGPGFYNVHLERIIRALKQIRLTGNFKTWLAKDGEIFGEIAVDPVDVIKFKPYLWMTKDEYDDETQIGN